MEFIDAYRDAKYSDRNMCCFTLCSNIMYALLSVYHRKKNKNTVIVVLSIIEWGWQSQTDLLL